ncbi:MAG TPA: ethanolamine ammonia-lyase reactivating factor EutA [Stellaceae bacterium]|jgi:ethanolamine utilization protein EutA|nr:ethanolamine ammonia-lyase reactivating factor EutA [Stellaceae bacterium]
MSGKDEDMHDTEFLHEHQHLEPATEEQREALAAFIWSQEHVELKTVGIDIGSSTSHLLFAKVILQRHNQGLSSRFVVVDRQVLWRSPIMLTPFLADGMIDAHALKQFIDKAYEDAGFARTDIDSGAVILTGEAIKRKNARAIDELFADEAGKFVCATAGHILECRLAAHGSGAVKLSRDREQCVLHVDIGGGTTKLSLIDQGRVVSSAAFAVGGRLIATDEHGKWTRVDDSARLVAEELGLGTAPHQLADPETRDALARRLATVAADYVLGTELDALGEKLRLTEPLRRTARPTAFTFSGGVSEYIFGVEAQQYGDIALQLARALTKELSERSGLPLVDPGQRIRATVIGASQFTIQVSGKTIYLSDPSILPVHGIPVVHVGRTAEEAPGELAETIRRGLVGLDLEADSRVAIAFPWQGDPDYARLAATARAIIAATAPQGARTEPLFLMIDGDIGRTLGRLLHEELGLPGPLVSIDGVQLQDLDYVDVGALMSPPGVVPVVIKSLLFS